MARQWWMDGPEGLPFYAGPVSFPAIKKKKTIMYFSDCERLCLLFIFRPNGV